MRVWGSIGEVDYERVGWSIHHLAYEYKLRSWWGEKTVYADNFKELEKQALEWQGEQDDER